MQTTPSLVQTLEHTAARLLMAAEQDRGNASEMRHLAARLQLMTHSLEPREAH